MPPSNRTIAVVGAGSWGTALARHLALLGHRVHLWAREAEVAEAIRRERVNPLFLSEVPLPPAVTATTDVAEALAEAEVVFSVIPSHAVRAVWTAAAPCLPRCGPFVSATKGIETGSGLLIHQVLQEVLPALGPERYACLSGPSFAQEVAAGKPTAVVVASAARETALTVQTLLAGPAFRVYTSRDVVGTELGGALKNVIALAVGLADGLALGANARAALITRGLAEIRRLAVRLGAEPLTLAGLAGVGDLVLTCTGHLSRNRAVGEALARGESLQAVLGRMRMVAEGVRTTRAARELGRRLGVELPITEAVYRVLYENESPRRAVAQLMQRPLKEEGAL